jgi:hypothetical protein
MVFVLLALCALPLLSIVLFLVKIVLRLSFSVGKVLLVLLVVWLIIGFATGGIQETIDHLGKPYVNQDEQGVVHYTGAFSTGQLDVGKYTAKNKLVEVEINCAFSKVDVKVPDNCIVRLNGRGLLTQLLVGQNNEFVAFGEKEAVFGSGDTIVELKINSGLAIVRIVH